jgi:hypothetical protein
MLESNHNPTAATIPNNAAAPTIPTSALLADPVLVANAAVVVGVMPLVNGTFVADVTPAKATPWLVAVGFGIRDVFAGLSTLNVKSQ